MAPLPPQSTDLISVMVSALTGAVTAGRECLTAVFDTVALVYANELCSDWLLTFQVSLFLQTSKLHVAFGSAQEPCVELHGMGVHGRAAASKPYITKLTAEHLMQWCIVPPLDSRAVETCSLE
ncbi:hypothetical protein NFI96_027948 [Prochilodus magdalenae]|nr:hypothetical protein NFI96_027948 [Prochilodus magdalenae]